MQITQQQIDRIGDIVTKKLTDDLEKIYIPLYLENPYTDLESWLDNYVIEDDAWNYLIGATAQVLGISELDAEPIVYDEELYTKIIDQDEFVKTAQEILDGNR